MTTQRYALQRTRRRIMPANHQPRYQRLRQVWAAVTANPQATYREIAAACGYRSWCQIPGLLDELAAYGHICIGHGARARTVLVPFVYTRKGVTVCPSEA